jgi:hypothetical protein
MVGQMMLCKKKNTDDDDNDNNNNNLMNIALDNFFGQNKEIKN